MSTYTETERKTLIDVYTKQPSLDTVHKLCNILNKPKKSIISKLVSEGVYETKGYVDHTGNKPVTKLELVRRMEDALDLKLPGLDKAPKETLRALSTTVTDLAEQFDNALDEIADYSENQRIQREMQKFSKNDDEISILLEGE